MLVGLFGGRSHVQIYYAIKHPSDLEHEYVVWVVVTAPKLGYQFLCCYSLLALIFKFFSWVCWMTLRNFVISNLSETLLMFLWVGKTSFASSQTLSNPNSKFLEFECGPCDYKGAIIFLDLLIIPIDPQRPFYLSEPWKCKNIAKSHAIFLNYDLFFSCLSEE